jgi:hypothetical protein
MEDDRIIDEIREARLRMSRECGHDPNKLLEALRPYNQKYVAQIAEYHRRHEAKGVSKPDFD